MHRTGHFGVSLLVVSIITIPIHPRLAIPLSLIMIATEPLPDYDMKISFIEHRGYSHTVVAAIAVGVIATALAAGFQTVLIDYAATLPAGAGVEFLIDTLPPLRLLIAVSFVGTVLGFLAHFIGDMITVGTGYHGVQPFKPVSDWELPIQLCGADDTLWNGGLLLIGTVAIAVSGYVQYSMLTGGI